jgi:hypothetical protein
MPSVKPAASIKGHNMMKNFLISKRIRLHHDQDIGQVKDFLKNTLEQTIDVTEISPGNEHFYMKGSMGSLFDFVRSARIFAEFDMICEESKTEKELRIIVKGSATLSYSMAFMYFALFCIILFAGLLPGSIETGSENSSALDAMVFLLIGYYIKTEIDRGLHEAEAQFNSTLNVLGVRFGY